MRIPVGAGPEEHALFLFGLQAAYRGRPLADRAGHGFATFAVAFPVALALSSQGCAARLHGGNGFLHAVGHGSDESTGGDPAFGDTREQVLPAGGGDGVGELDQPLLLQIGDQDTALGGGE